MSRIARRTFGLVSWSLALATLAACSEPPSSTPETTAAPPAAGAGVTVFTGARLLVGDGTVIDNATFTVGPDNRFGLVGATAAVTVPAGAATVDLTGRTVMPAIVDTHTHLSRDRAGLTADLKHRAYFGVSAAMSLGQDNTDDIYAMRREVIPGHALYRTAGRGFTAPEPGRTDIPYWITTAEEGRAGVREQAALGVDIIKVWVDDRMGQYPKLAPELYGAVIEEAHANGPAHDRPRVLPRRCERARAPWHRRVCAHRARAHRRRVRRHAQGAAELRGRAELCPTAASRRT